MSYKIRKAILADSQSIQQLVQIYASKEKMLARSLQYIHEHIRDFHIAVNDENKIIGVCSFVVSQRELAEAKSLAISNDYQKIGVASALLASGTKEIKKLGISKLFCLTYAPGFFEKNGFHQINKEKLPHKIWTECIHCPSFPNCNEIALIKSL